MMWRTAVGTLAVLSICSAAGAQSLPQIGGDLGTLGVPLPLFPASNWWNLDITSAPSDPDSTAKFLDSATSFVDRDRGMHADMGGIVAPNESYGIPYAVVDGSQQKKVVIFEVPEESDGVGVAFYPIPDAAKTDPYWIEGGPPGTVVTGGDRHMLIVDRTNNDLYELYNLSWDGSNWNAYSGAFFDMDASDRRPEGWTSSDAAGLAVLPGLLRYDEVYVRSEEIGHALRVTVHGSNGHVYPASHSAGSNPAAPPMGTRFRLKAGTDISGFTPAAQKIFRAMKKYGLIVADNGSDMYVTGTFDTRWFDDDYAAIDEINGAFGDVHASDFEVIELGYNPPGLAAADVSVPEGMPASFTITRTGGTAATASVDWATANGTAAAGSDYVALSGTANFPIGESTASVDIPTIADSVKEPSETFFLNLSNPQPPDLTMPDAQAKATIARSYGLPGLSVGDARINEPLRGFARVYFPVTLSAASAQTVSVKFATSPGTATAGADYTSRTGTILFHTGETQKRIGVVVKADGRPEGSETFFVTLSGPAHASLTDDDALGTIVDRSR